MDKSEQERRFLLCRTAQAPPKLIVKNKEERLLSGSRSFYLQENVVIPDMLIPISKLQNYSFADKWLTINLNAFCGQITN